MTIDVTNMTLENMLDELELHELIELTRSRDELAQVITASGELASSSNIDEYTSILKLVTRAQLRQLHKQHKTRARNKRKHLNELVFGIYEPNKIVEPAEYTNKFKYSQVIN